MAELFGGSTSRGTAARKPIGPGPMRGAGTNAVDEELAQGPPSQRAPISRHPLKAMATGPSRSQSIRRATVSARLPVMVTIQYPAALRGMSRLGLSLKFEIGPLALLGG